MQHAYDTRNFCEFCKKKNTPTRNFCEFSKKKKRARNFCAFYKNSYPYPGYGCNILYLNPIFFVTSVQHPHNTRNFCGFCKKTVPVPDTSVSPVRRKFPTRNSQNPTEHNRGIFWFTLSCFQRREKEGTESTFFFVFFQPAGNRTPFPHVQQT